MPKSTFYPNPVPGGPGIVADTSGEGPAAYERTEHLSGARTALARATAAAVDAPGAAQGLRAVRDAVARADDLDIAAQDANALVPIRERERNHAERVAFADGKDPVAATRDAQAALDAAQAAAATANRIADAGALEALRMAKNAERRANQAAVNAAPRVVRNKLRELEKARAEAREAVEIAARKMLRVSSLAHNAVMTSRHLREGDPLSRLARVQPLNPTAKPTSNSNRLSIDAVIHEMRDVVGVRFSYSNGGFQGYQTLGVELGKAVRHVAEEDSANGE